MKYLLKSIHTYLILTFIISLCSCSKQSKKADKNLIKIGYITNSELDSCSSNLITDTIRKYSKDYKISLTKVNALNNKEVLEQIDNLHKTGVNGLIISITNPKLGPVIVSRVKRYGLKIIVLNNRLLNINNTFTDNVPFIGISKIQASETISRVLLKEISTKQWYKKNTAILLINSPNNTTNQSTIHTTKELLIKYGIPEENILIQNPEATNIYTITSQYFSILNNKNIVVFGFNQKQVNFELKSLEKNLKKKKEIIAFGFSLSPDFSRNLDKNYIGNLYINPDIYAKNILNSLIKWIKLDKKPNLVTYIDLVFMKRN